jgi:hypothetical protein
MDKQLYSSMPLTEKNVIRRKPNDENECGEAAQAS